MILSSADILQVIGGDSVIRLLAKIQIVDGKPPITGEEGLFIYIDRFPVEREFEAVWKLWIIDYSGEPVDLVLNRLKALLPSVQVFETALGFEIESTDFKYESTQTKPVEVKAEPVDLSAFEQRFKELTESVEDRMLTVFSGQPGQDGKDGKDGRDGLDGKDLDATGVSLGDLGDVDLESYLDLKRGQVLTWDGKAWTNLLVPQILSSGRGGGGGTAVATTENCDVHDGGDFDTGQAIAPTCSGLTSTTIVTESTYQVIVSDAYIGVNYNGLVTITMPTGTNNGLKYMIKDESGLAGQPANYITIVGDGSDLIDSESSVVIGFNYGSLTLIWRDGAWRII
jgi:hypothetical protein